VCRAPSYISEGRIVAEEKPSALEARSRYHHAVSMRFDKPDRVRRLARREVFFASLGRSPRSRRMIAN